MRALRNPFRIAVVLMELTAVAILVGLLFALVPAWPPKARCALPSCQEGREWLSFAITGFVLLAGLFQYRKAQRWKRAEFVAQEMTAFFSNPMVLHATLMIDWAARHLNVLGSEDKELTKWPLVTRQLQSRALLPHKLVIAEGSETAVDSAIGGDSDLARFTIVEAAIRDRFDVFLDGLERFSGYLDTGLVTVADLRPWLGYWIDDIADTAVDAADGEWTCSLFSYIHAYKFAGVQSLFRRFGYDIQPSSAFFATFLRYAPLDRRRGLRVLFGLPQEDRPQ